MLIVTLALLGSPQASGQGTPPAQKSTPPSAEKPGGLKVFVLEGAGAVNFIPDGKGETIVVEVRDENDLPVEAAEVRFELPQSGPGGFFAGGERTLLGKTNLQGQAAAPFSVNAQPGIFHITISATFRDLRGQATVAQENSLKPVNVSAGSSVGKQRHWYTNWKILAVAAACGAVVGIVVGTRGGKSSTPTVVITPGSPTFGGPQ